MAEENATLGTLFPKEIATAKEKLKGYKEIGTAGNFACSWIEPLVLEAEKALEDQDTVKMIQLFPKLEGIAW